MRCRRPTRAIPGAPMALAPIAYLLYTRVMKHNPAEPDWFDRDRFVLSAGHASMLLYSIAAPDRLRADASRTSRTSASSAAPLPAIPSTRRRAPASRSPPGRWARASRTRSALRWPSAMLAARFNTRRPRDDRPLHLRDRQRRRHAGGSGLRGVLAGRPPRARQADRLLRRQPHPARRRDRRWPSARTWAKRYEAYGWHVQNLGEDLELDTIEEAIEAAHAVADRPSLIILRTHIGYGSPNKQDTPGGARLAARARTRCDSPRRPTAGTPTPISSSRTRCASTSRDGRRAGRAAEAEWNERLEAYRREQPELAEPS